MKKSSALILLLLNLYTVWAQDTISFSSTRSYSFLIPENNRIQNTTNLATYFDKLYQLRQKKEGKVNIIHIGDSHIQADFLTASVRENLQRTFGNGGRGLVFPGRVARTNEPSSIYSSSNGSWDSKRIVYVDQPLPIGIYPLTIRTKQPNTRLVLKINDVGDLSYRFNRLTLFFQKDFSSFNLAVKDSAGNDLAYIGPYTFEQPNTSSIHLPTSLRHLELLTLQSHVEQTQFQLYGIHLENEHPGIIYHALGGNGAKFKHYNAARYFAEQTSALRPELVIISLGTNEAIEHPYIDSQLINQIDELISSLKKFNPEVRFILTTPPDAFKRKTRRNPGIESVRNKIINYADQNNHAWWDLYETGGGKHNADHWKKAGLMQSDGIHFTKAGYELQGRLLYEALIKAYNEYVLYRYP
jgi:lysophospholipase L1-like esterase